MTARARLALSATMLLAVACGGDDGDGVAPPVDGAAGEPDACTGAACACTAATDCGPHRYCDDGGTCACVDGYDDAGGACRWTGGLRDPALSMPAVWMARGGAVIDGAAAGHDDPGAATFTTAALCTLGRVAQTIDMPTRERGEPLVLELTYQDRSPGTDEVLMGASFGGAWSPLPYFGDADFHTARFCLPEGAYAPRGTEGAGAPVEISFGPYWQPEGCPATQVVDFAIDHAAIVADADGLCGPAPGRGRNWDAEGDGGWTFTAAGPPPGSFVDGAGAGGSRGARIALTARCQTSTMTTRLDVPAVANPAVSLFVAAGPNTSATINFGGLVTMPAFDRAMPVAQSRTIHACLPPAVRGQTMSVRFDLALFGGTCGDPIDQSLVADQLEVVDDPACASGPDLADPGFEAADPPWGAVGLVGAGTSIAAIRTDAAGARGGTRYLALEAHGLCSNARYTLLPVAPPAEGSAGPALELYTRIAVNPDAFTTVQALGNRQPRLLPEGGTWERQIVCLDPKYTGRPQRVVLRHEAGAGGCTGAYVEQDAFVDDVRVTVDASCPN